MYSNILYNNLHSNLDAKTYVTDYYKQSNVIIKCLEYNHPLYG